MRDYPRQDSIDGRRKTIVPEKIVFKGDGFIQSIGTIKKFGADFSKINARNK
ncbi:MAG: hypothetical protein IPM95_07580 [Sphingobacteriales bacterium]|nr:hypothetical protein [Sphingobacteriales bacterium]